MLLRRYIWKDSIISEQPTIFRADLGYLWSVSFSMDDFNLLHSDCYATEIKI